MKMPGNMYIGGGINSNSRKKLSGELDFRYFRTFQDVREAYELGIEIEYRPINTLTLSVEPEWSRTWNLMQYVTQETLEDGAETPRYIFASIDQKVLSISLRADYNITPDLTIQYWGQPFFGSGDYSEFKRITDPGADEFNDRYGILGSGSLSYAIRDRLYSIDEDLDSSVDYTFDNPDFTVSEFLHNLVVRWEFLPGSTAYLVWSQTREYSEDSGLFDFGRQSADLFSKTKAHNVFLIKFSYRFGL